MGHKRTKYRYQNWVRKWLGMLVIILLFFLLFFQITRIIRYNNRLGYFAIKLHRESRLEGILYNHPNRNIFRKLPHFFFLRPFLKNAKLYIPTNLEMPIDVKMFQSISYVKEIRIIDKFYSYELESLCLDYNCKVFTDKAGGKTRIILHPEGNKDNIYYGAYDQGELNIIPWSLMLSAEERK